MGSVQSIVPSHAANTMGTTMARDKAYYSADWKREKARQEKNGDVLERKLTRQRARYDADKEGVNRAGKDLAHRKALSKVKGGKKGGGVFLASPSDNRSFKRNADSSIKGKGTDSPKRKK